MTASPADRNPPTEVQVRDDRHGGSYREERLAHLEDLAAAPSNGLCGNSQPQPGPTSTALHRIRLTFANYPRPCFHNVTWRQPAVIPPSATHWDANGFEQLLEYTPGFKHEMANIRAISGPVLENGVVSYLIEIPRAEDAENINRMHFAAWLQTYPNEAAGIDEAWIREHRGPSATTREVALWGELIEKTARWPARFFCRVVRSDGRIIGLICGRRDEEHVDEMLNLGPMYLLAEAQGQGIGGRLMHEFLSWAGNAPIRLWVASYNESAIGFYQHYGFTTTGERELWQGKLPNIRMVRWTDRGRIAGSVEQRSI